MCGLFGYKTDHFIDLKKKSKRKRYAIATTLGRLMETRGTHSSGYAYAKDKKVATYKQAVAFSDLDASRMFHSPFVIGHTRFATVGGVTTANAHPFIDGKIVGAHNGGISNYKQFMADATVDSQAIFHILNKSGEDGLLNLNGEMAISWMETDTNQIKLVRHDNPLCVAYVPELSTLFWASTESSLKTAIGTFYTPNVTTLPIDVRHTILENGAFDTKELKLKSRWVSSYLYDEELDKYPVLSSGKTYTDVSERFPLLGSPSYSGNYNKNYNQSVTASEICAISEWNGCEYCQSKIKPRIEPLYYDRFNGLVYCKQCWRNIEVNGLELITPNWIRQNLYKSNTN